MVAVLEMTRGEARKQLQALIDRSHPAMKFPKKSAIGGHVFRVKDRKIQD